MNKITYFLTASLLVLAPFSKAFSNEQVIIQKAISIPTCYQKPNDAVDAALAITEKQAVAECGKPVWLLNVDVKINPRSANSVCGDVVVVADYSCQ